MRVSFEVNSGRTLKALRVLQGVRQVELAQSMQRSQAWLSRVENEDLIPTPEQMQTMIGYLKNG